MLNMSSIILVACLSATPCVDEWPIPKVRELEQRYRRSPNLFTNTIKVSQGYILGSGECLLSTSAWIIIPLDHSHRRYSQRGGEVRPVELIAVHVQTGKTRQLTLTGNEAAKKDTGAAIVRCFPLTAEVCGVEIWRPWHVKKQPKGRPEYEAFLWEWDVEDNQLTAVGEWEALGQLASVLDLTACSLRWCTVRGRAWDGIIEIRDKRTRRSTKISVDTTVREWGGHTHIGRLFAPGPESHTFIVCDSAYSGTSDIYSLASGVQVLCVDPRQPSGRRWRIGQQELQKQIGFPPIL